MSHTDSSAKALFGFKLVMFTRRWRKAVHSELAASGLTDATWAPLVHLDADPGGMSQTELAERLTIDTSSLVRLLDILVDRGLVERQVDPTDRRARRIVLTEPGQQEVSQIKQHLTELEAGFLAQVGIGEIETVLDVFDRISATIESIPEKTTR